jgi:RNA polymerase sigma-70 factor (ECF subfamily)
MSDALRALLERLLAEHRATIRRAIQRTLPAPLTNDLDDIEQEVILRLWRVLESEKEITSPASYLHMTAVNATIDAIRRRRARPEVALDLENEAEPTVRIRAATASPEDQATRRQQLARARQALGSIAPNRARAVKLHLQGFTTQEVGDLLGWTEAKARNLVYRGLDDLRRALAEN